MTTPISDPVLEAVNRILLAAGIRTTFTNLQALKCLEEAARQIDKLRAAGVIPKGGE